MDTFTAQALTSQHVSWRNQAINEIGFGPGGAGSDEHHEARLNVVRSLAQEDDRKRPAATFFRISRYLRCMAESRPVDPYERVVIERAAARMEQAFDRNRAWIPFGGLATRTLNTSSGSQGGYLTGTENLEPADALRPWSVTASAGVQIIDGLRDAVTIPTVKTPPAGTWVAQNAAPGSTTEPVLGQASAAPHCIIAVCNISRQLLKQGDSAEPFLRALLMRALGEALDRAVFAGAGGAEPLGILSATGIGTQAGASFDHADALAMKRQVLAAGAQEDALRWVGDPATQELLGARALASGGDRFIWEGRQILDCQAHATKNAPANKLVVGDFRQAVVTIWGPGARIDIDPTQDFATGGVALRAMLFADIVAMQPSAFCVATGVS